VIYDVDLFADADGSDAKIIARAPRVLLLRVGRGAIRIAR
jgi:hypothetical protein